MKLLLVIDMQNDFIDGALGTKEAVAIVDKVNERICKARKEGETVWFTRDTHQANYMESQEGRHLPVPHCIEGTAGWEISPRLDVAESFILDKPSFGSLELAEAVAKVENLESIELIGLCTDICVISNALILKAKLPEIPVSVNAPCCAGVTPESHDNALAAMRMCQVQVVEA